MKSFEIAFSSLKEGEHNFEFEIGKEIFEFFDYTDFNKVDIDGKLLLKKEKTMIALNFEAKGSIECDCDRCNESLDIDVDCAERVLLKFSDREIESRTEEIVYISPLDTKIDVSIFFYEMILLSLPLQKTHRPGECDEDILRIMDQINEKDKVEMDPRWDALKKLK